MTVLCKSISNRTMLTPFESLGVPYNMPQTLKQLSYLHYLQRPPNVIDANLRLLHTSDAIAIAIIIANQRVKKTSGSRLH